MIDWQQADLLDGVRRSHFGPHLHDAAPLAAAGIPGVPLPMLVLTEVG